MEMGNPQWIGLLVFTATYGLIVSEKLDRVAAAMGGICAVLLLRLVDQEQAFSFIDFNTIGLLMGMMILVGVVKKTGLIELAAVKAISLSSGSPLKLIVLLSVLTAVVSSFLDNVTTVLITGPIVMAVCDVLDLNPMPFALSMIFASNIGGAATLIGDPPNILIGSAAKLSFNDFIANMAIPSAVSLAASILTVIIIYRKDLSDSPRSSVNFDQGRQRLDPVITPRVLVILAMVMGAFLLHHALHLEAATIALTGAAAALITCKVDVEELIMHEVDWVTLVFFSALFMLVGTVDHLGIISKGARLMVNQLGNNPRVVSMVIIWGSGVISGVVDNVPYAAAMIPMVRDLAHFTGTNITPLWWSLALGSCLGGNSTLVGASANIVTARIAQRSGCNITFTGFLKAGIPVSALTLLISSAYVLIRYYW
ncbi:Na+/H+ antiporter NhaD-like permease [Thermanaerovibrio velox DSM 12556]|uniref:Na+/H+ antiporter NhaD-like permease n=1 Tax=Thermanaerovibrio velox DSM 12556 TaxID=926567 RepID=H0UQC8_9BACT|nr:ArsB/NhaD family transporter [Thermanaerovibrio velox]EHM09682.1 Na+/H+ antiporter NhaD-like permease [Thermanaerovibrio velox DSM 12556]